MLNYCVPLDGVTDISKYLGGVGWLQEYFADLFVCWPLVLGMLGISLFVSIVYSVLIRFFAGFVIWTMIITLILVSLAVGLVTAMISSVGFLQTLFNYDRLPAAMQDRTYQIIASVIGFTIFVVTVLIVCCMRRQIRICKSC